ncbi:MAG: hypothetical protein JF614_19700 [Acidobacteria bacterium]|nr:hypothetical protein [Acidobacteriota bacterium]
MNVSWLDGHVPGPAIEPEHLCKSLEQLEERCAQREPALKAFLPEKDRFARLRREAEEALAAHPDPSDPRSRSSLFGVPIGVKDVFHVDGLPTTPAAACRRRS